MLTRSLNFLLIDTFPLMLSLSVSNDALAPALPTRASQQQQTHPREEQVLQRARHGAHQASAPPHTACIDVIVHERPSSNMLAQI